LFVGPAELRGNAYLSFGTDEHVEWPHISQFSALRVEGVGGVDDGEDEVPKFCLFEALALHAVPVEDFVLEEVGVVLEGDLHGRRSTVVMPPLPQNSVFSNLRPTGRKRFSLYAT
jgi:hypothetical protein